MKKNSKKLLALLLSASMTVGVLAGCGAKSTNNEVAPATENANEAISEKSEADGNTPRYFRTCRYNNVSGGRYA